MRRPVPIAACCRSACPWRARSGRSRLHRSWDRTYVDADAASTACPQRAGYIGWMNRSGDVEDPRLSHHEERFRLIVESVRDYAICMLDPAGRVLTLNPGAERFHGYRAEEIIGQNFARFYPTQARERGLPAHELTLAAQDGVFEDEGWRVRKDGSLFWANVVLTAVRDAEGELVGFAKVVRDMTQRHIHEEDVRRSEERFRLLVEG